MPDQTPNPLATASSPSRQAAPPDQPTRQELSARASQRLRDLALLENQRDLTDEEQSEQHRLRLSRAALTDTTPYQRPASPSFGRARPRTHDEMLREMGWDRIEALLAAYAKDDPYGMSDTDEMSHTRGFSDAEKAAVKWHMQNENRNLPAASPSGVHGSDDDAVGLPAGAQDETPKPFHGVAPELDRTQTETGFYASLYAQATVDCVASGGGSTAQEAYDNCVADWNAKVDGGSAAPLVEALRAAIGAVTAYPARHAGEGMIHSPQIGTATVDRWRAALAQYESGRRTPPESDCTTGTATDAASQAVRPSHGEGHE